MGCGLNLLKIYCNCGCRVGVEGFGTRTGTVGDADVSMPMDERSPTMFLRAGWLDLRRISQQGDGGGGDRKIDWWIGE